MRATLESLANSRATLHIEVDPERVEEALEQAYRRVVRRVQVPGFRKGKTPRPILERHVGKGTLYEEAVEVLVPEAYRFAVEQTQIEPVEQPEVDIISIEEGKPWAFRAEVSVKPAVKLGRYKGMKLTKKIEQVSNEQVERTLDSLREQQATLEAVDRDVVEKGDFVTLDFEGLLDGQPFQGGAAKDVVLQVGSGRFVPGFEEQLIGLRKGEGNEIHVTFPAEYDDERLAGKEVLFRVKVHEIKVKRLPEANDAFAASLGDFKTLLDLRAQIRKDLEERAQRRAEEGLRDEAVERLIDVVEVDAIPEILVKREVESTMLQFVQGLAMRGVNPQMYIDEREGGADGLRKEFRPAAERRVLATLGLEAVAKSEGIEVSEAEVLARIGEERQGRQEGASGGDGGGLSDRDLRRLRDAMLVEKTIDFLIENAEVTEERVDPENEAQEEGASS